MNTTFFKWLKSCLKITLNMKSIYIIVFSLLCTLSLAQWPNSVDKRLPINISGNYNLITGTQYDAQGSTYVAIKPGRFVSKSYPYDTYYVPIRFQKLDKNGFELWNIDSTQVICDSYISIPERDGGMYVFYNKFHNPKSNEPIYNNKLSCAYIDKNGIKKWDTELDSFNIFGTGNIYPLSANINAEGNIELYFLKKKVVYYQVLDKTGNKLLNENKALSEELENPPVYSSEGFVYFKQEYPTPTFGVNFLLSKRTKDWTDIWKKEIKIEGNETIDKIFDSPQGTVVLGRSGQNILYLTLINAKGDILSDQKQLINLRDFISNPNLGEVRYHFDIENNLHLYLQVSYFNNTQQLKVIYVKINAQGEIVVNKELQAISNRIIESFNIVPRGLYREKDYDFSINEQGNLLLSWKKKANDLEELYLSKFDSEGNLLWNEDKLIDRDSTIISVTNIPPTDSTNAVFYLTGKFQYANRYPYFHSSDFYLKQLTKNGNFNELSASMPDKVCRNSNLDLKLHTEGTYEENNQFRVLLSDAKGDFSHAKEIAVSKQTSFTINNLSEIEGDYKVKVVSTYPVVEVMQPWSLKILEIPQFTYEYKTEIMKFDSALVKLRFLTGVPPYKLKLWDDKVVQTSSNTYETYVKPAVTSEYTIKSVADANCANGPISFKITVLEPLSTEWQARDNINIYPIPATTSLTIEVNNEVMKNGSIVIYDIAGKPIYQNQNSGGTINLKGLIQGTYVLKGYINGKTFSRKILVER